MLTLPAQMANKFGEGDPAFHWFPRPLPTETYRYGFPDLNGIGLPY
jgi:hypothetical protein